MSSRITADDVARVARLSRLELTETERVAIAAELGAVLDHFADIDALDLEDVEGMYQPVPLVNVMRDDVVTPTLRRADVMDRAPAVEQDQFRVPPIGTDA